MSVTRFGTHGGLEKITVCSSKSFRSNPAETLSALHYLHADIVQSVSHPEGLSHLFDIQGPALFFFLESTYPQCHRVQQTSCLFPSASAPSLAASRARARARARELRSACRARKAGRLGSTAAAAAATGPSWLRVAVIRGTYISRRLASCPPETN